MAAGLVTEGHGAAQRVVEPRLGHEGCDSRPVIAADLVVRILRREGVTVLLEIEWPRRRQVHGSAKRAFVSIGRGRLAHLQRAEKVRGEVVEIEPAAAV